MSSKMSLSPHFHNSSSLHLSNPLGKVNPKKWFFIFHFSFLWALNLPLIYIYIHKIPLLVSFSLIIFSKCHFPPTFFKMSLSPHFSPILIFLMTSHFPPKFSTLLFFTIVASMEAWYLSLPALHFGANLPLKYYFFFPFLF